MKWATRRGIHIDRAATAWLITTFIDPEATFVYVDDPADVPGDATPFDMRGVDLGHHGDDVTFETVLRRHQLDDPVLWRLAEIVHEADLHDDRFHAPEADGIDLLVRALSESHTDEEVRAFVAEMLSSLYAHLRRRILAGG